MSKYEIFMRLRGEVSLVITNLDEEKADDHVKTLNQLSNEGELYYKKMILEERQSIMPVQTPNSVVVHTHDRTELKNLTK